MMKLRKHQRTALIWGGGSLAGMQLHGLLSPVRAVAARRSHRASLASSLFS